VLSNIISLFPSGEWQCLTFIMPVSVASPEIETESDYKVEGFRVSSLRCE
jgi:hypothetical protein